jgi:glucan phosphoethanolaminetransferase (alkaline phosphatase superfamily)
MLHTLSTPTWDSGYIWGYWLIPVATALIVLGVGIWLTARYDIRRAWNRRRQVKVILICGVGVALLAGFVTGSIVTEANTSGAHRAQIASWLHDEYGATVNPAKLAAGRDAPDVIQTTATIDGRVRVIKLMPTPDGHVAVFGTDDKPLTKRH